MDDRDAGPPQGPQLAELWTHSQRHVEEANGGQGAERRGRRCPCGDSQHRAQAKEHRLRTVFAGGRAGLCSVSDTQLSELGAGVVLYFRFLVRQFQ